MTDPVIIGSPGELNQLLKVHESELNQNTNQMGVTLGMGAPTFSYPSNCAGLTGEHLKQCQCDLNNTCAQLMYYYHPDHVGSSTYLSDFNGQPYQFLLYLPFGETFVEQNVAGWATPYQFNGKEEDENTALYYYGARYYDPRISLWHGVDPLAEKYPNISPYVYVADNPIRYIDPDGRWIYDQQKDGSYKKRIGVKNDGGANVHTYHERNGTVHYFNQKEKTFVTIKPGQIERAVAARETKKAAIVKAIGNGIKKTGEVVSNAGDIISVGSAVLAAPTGGASASGIVVGEGMGLVGTVLENTGNFIANGVNSETGTDLLVDLAFEVLPAGAEKVIKTSNINTAAEKIAKEKLIKEGGNPDLIPNTENILFWRTDAVLKATEYGVKNQPDKEP